MFIQYHHGTETQCVSVRSETVTCECKHAMENIRYCIKAEQIVVVGQYDGEAAPAATSCSLSGEPQPLAHLSQYRLFTVCVCVLWREQSRAQ